MKGLSYQCRHCGAVAARWQGRCAACAQWNGLEEVGPPRGASQRTPVAVTPLGEASATSSRWLSTGLVELDRVLGGGLVAGSTTLLYGEPGVGKSTLALLALRAVATRGERVVLVAAEESADQVAGRARRAGDVPPSLYVATTNEVDDAVALVSDPRWSLCVVDSVSALSDASVTGATGSVAQVRQAAERLCRAAHASGTALILIGHVTKDGELAGPRALEHVVDTVVRVEGDRHGTLRIVRAQKHRFGPTGEVGLFEMAGSGLREITDASLALRGPRLEVPGVVLTVTNDGSRCFLVEIQALVARSSGPSRRVAHQVSAQRLALLLAVLESRCALETSGLDVFVSSVGGLAATEPGVDVAVAIAVASAIGDFVVAPDVVALGEVGLAGELRPVLAQDRRVREAQRLGATRVLVPAGTDEVRVAGVEVVVCASITDVVAAARESGVGHPPLAARRSVA